MTGEKRYYKIPFLKTKFFIQWVDGKFQRVGLQKPMSFLEAFTRLERKRLRREKDMEHEKDLIDLQEYEEQERFKV